MYVSSLSYITASAQLFLISLLHITIMVSKQNMILPMSDVCCWKTKYSYSNIKHKEHINQKLEELKINLYRGKFKTSQLHLSFGLVFNVLREPMTAKVSDLHIYNV